MVQKLRHLPACILSAGPPVSTALFKHERKHGQLKRLVHGSRSPEAQFVVAAQSIDLLTAHRYKDPSTFFDLPEDASHFVKSLEQPPPEPYHPSSPSDLLGAGKRSVLSREYLELVSQALRGLSRQDLLDAAPTDLIRAQDRIRTEWPLEASDLQRRVTAFQRAVCRGVVFHSSELPTQKYSSPYATYDTGDPAPQLGIIKQFIRFTYLGRPLDFVILVALQPLDPLTFHRPLTGFVVDGVGGRALLAEHVHSVPAVLLCVPLTTLRNSCLALKIRDGILCVPHRATSSYVKDED
eukprot:TRINITY_DN30771_c0_g1_i1.p1 TRINITY_DN30771_c0_g1~~TRINITY_DN30771_c0_g1_i1.p1  ORF type:complete len:295 (+),score=26.02 TRINITY_DN30771_c0_g1_i1:79-963(+)